MNKIGFACKYKAIEENKKKKEIKEEEQNYNTTTTTLSFLRNKTKQEQYDKMLWVINKNFIATENLLKYVSTLPEGLRMLRITSDMLPFYTHEYLSWFYSDSVIFNLIESSLFQLGEIARRENIRISFHPGQFCVLASENERTIQNSIEEFEYHATMAKLMGYAKKFQDLKCNIHISGTGGVEKFIESWHKLTPEARNILTVENAEFKYGVDDCLKVSKYCPIVLDVHHAWINEESYFSFKDPRKDLIIESWRGLRPVMHYSQSREELFPDQNPNDLLKIKELLNNGFSKRALSAHSDMMWNNAMNDYIEDFTSEFDIMVEAKHKNLSSIALYNYLKKASL